MLTMEEVVDKLYQQPRLFYGQFYVKNYAVASMIEYAAHIVARFIELDEEKMLELFGSRQGYEPVEGMFIEEDVIKANWEVMLHHKTLQEQTREEKREREEAWEQTIKK